MTERHIDKAYTARTPEETRAVYDAWSATYDAEIADLGYATPGRAAALLAAFLGDHDAPILDFGCGTGLSGAALAAVGVSVIDGMDISEGMLATARARGVYRALTLLDPAEPVPAERGAYRAIAAVGVIGAGAAPLATLDRLVDLLEPGGLLVFSFNDHTLKDPACEARVALLVGGGLMAQRTRDYGDHLPGRDMKSVIYVLEKT